MRIKIATFSFGCFCTVRDHIKHHTFHLIIIQTLVGAFNKHLAMEFMGKSILLLKNMGTLTEL